jgi:hypothetical protein
VKRRSAPEAPEREGSLADLLRRRDRDALAGFYDARAGYVRAYCEAICPPAAVGDATFAAFVEFLARADGAGSDDDLDLLLVKATRGCAARRMAIDASQAICRAMPEVLAARANGEDARHARALETHVDGCPTCHDTASRLLHSEQALKGEPRSEPTADVRERWLEIASARRPYPAA